MFTILVSGAIKRALSNTYKCLYNIIIYVLAILIIVLTVSLISSTALWTIFFSIIAHEVFSTGTSISADHCNLVSYYLAFAEIGIILSIVVIAILIVFFALIHTIAKCLK